MLNKTQFRKLLLAERRAILLSEQDAAAERAAQLFIQHPLFSSSQHIACYSGREDEFHCTPIMKEIWRAEKTCYLPVLSSIENYYLEFYRHQQNDSLRFNKYKILEPLPDQAEKIAPAELDIVLVPLVGFDLKGNRLGMGAGYYDRTFSFLKKEGEKKPYLIGLAYECQAITVLPHDEWDVTLHAVLTDKQWHIF